MVEHFRVGHKKILAVVVVHKLYSSITVKQFCALLSNKKVNNYSIICIIN